MTLSKTLVAMSMLLVACSGSTAGPVENMALKAVAPAEDAGATTKPTPVAPVDTPDADVADTSARVIDAAPRVLPVTGLGGFVLGMKHYDAALNCQAGGHRYVNVTTAKGDPTIYWKCAGGGGVWTEYEFSLTDRGNGLEVIHATRLNVDAETAFGHLDAFVATHGEPTEIVRGGEVVCDDDAGAHASTARWGDSAGRLAWAVFCRDGIPTEIATVYVGAR